MVKLSDIAKFLGVSITTVSYSLNNDPRIPAATKQRVIDAANQLGYTGKSGKSANKDYLKQIVLCLNTLKGDVYSDIIAAMKATLNLNNCELMVYVGSEITRIKWMDGLFVLNSRVKNEDIEQIASRRIPAVLMDREVDIDGTMCVTLDNFKGCNAVTQRAIEQGARSFVFIGGPKESYESQYRYNGFCKALSDNGLMRRDILTLQTDFTYVGGLNACRFVLERESAPDAIVCANDETAMGIVAGLKAGNVTKDVIVTGFDGLVDSSHMQYRFITAKADHKYWATTSSYSMLQMFEHGVQHDMKIPVQVIDNIA